MIGRQGGELIHLLSTVLHRYRPAWVVRYFDENYMHVYDGACIPEFADKNGWVEEEQEVGRLIDGINREYQARLDELRVALRVGDVDRARGVLRSIGEFLEGRGFNPWPIIDEVNARIRRGGGVREYINRLGRMYMDAVWGLITSELASRYLVLDGGDYLLVLLGRRGGGRYVLPTSEYDVLRLLSGLFPNDVRLLEGVVDADTAFAVALKRLAGTPYAKELAEAFLDINIGLVDRLDELLDRLPSTISVTCLPSVVRTLRLGYLSKIITSDTKATIIEFPSLPYHVFQPTELMEYFSDC